ncbi:PglZ domain-containing protein [Desulfobacterales bacterium HSG17]|nr:PglZ domain-containing protein [Desulfobacterales bacterium HSG17]
MSWQKHIINRLNIRKGYGQLILDKTNVLVHRGFLDYLKKQSIYYKTTDSLVEIISLIKNQEILVISPFIEIPCFVSQRTDIKILDYPQLPVEIDNRLAQKLDTDKLIILLEYRDQTGQINLITENNLEKELANAQYLKTDLQIKALKHDLEKMPENIQDYEGILDIGRIWGQYVYACFESRTCPDFDFMEKVDLASENFVFSGRFENAFYVTERNLKTVNKILPFLKTVKAEKMALICFDGMGVAEWILLKKYLSGFEFSERYLFALIPTITKISRTAIFCGDYESAYSLKKIDEAKAFFGHFKNMACKFFREGKISEDHVLGIDRLAIIYNCFDDIGHETKLPAYENTKSVYFNNVLTYLNHSGIREELNLLKDHGYSIFICSDHGCVAGQGNGQRIDKYLIEESSKRATLITMSALAQFYDVNHYQIPFISDNRAALLAKSRTLFAHKNYTGISHGGISLEELIVPFAEVMP